MAGVVPTRAIIAERISGVDTCCVLCNDQEETYLHLFKQCPFSRAMAFANKWGCILENSIANTFSEVIDGCLASNLISQGMRKEFTAVFLSTLFYCC